MGLFAVFAVAFGALVGSGFRVIGHSSARQTAVQIASRELEAVRSAPFDTVGHAAAPAAEAAPSPDSRISGTRFAVAGVGDEEFAVDSAYTTTHRSTSSGENITFTIYRYVTVPTAPAGVKRATVTVIWNGGTARNTVEVSSLVTPGSLSWS